MKAFSVFSITVVLLGMALSAEHADAASVTSQITHKIMRSDGSRVAKGEKHEFNGGSHLFYKSLSAKKTQSERTLVKSTTKKGWVRLILDWPTQLKSIVIRKASVGNDSFRGGHISLDIQTIKGKWITVFERNDSDIDSPVSVGRNLLQYGPIKGVRLKFLTPFPITIGPIDING